MEFLVVVDVVVVLLLCGRLCPVQTTLYGISSCVVNILPNPMWTRPCTFAIFWI